MNWNEHWPQVEKILKTSRSRSSALIQISELRGEPTSWDAVHGAAYRRGIAAHSLVGQSVPMEPAESIRTVLTDDGSKHLIIPDTQVRPGVPLDHFTAIGNYIVEKGPDVVIHLGDHWDMPSLSSFESRSKKASMGRCKMEDISSGNAALEALEAPLIKANFQPKRKIILEGNHDGFAPHGRFGRYFDEVPEDVGLITLSNFADSWLGWERIPFLTPILVDGIAYCHLFPFNAKGKVTNYGVRYGASNPDIQVRACFRSATAGHKQGLQVGSIMTDPFGQGHRGIIAGSCYMHEEEYLGPARYWRGILVKNNVHPENNPDHYSLCEVALAFLLRRYSD